MICNCQGSRTWLNGGGASASRAIWGSYEIREFTEALWADGFFERDGALLVEVFREACINFARGAYGIKRHSTSNGFSGVCKGSQGHGTLDRKTQDTSDTWRDI